MITSPPKVIWEECVATPISENALSHCVCYLKPVQSVTKRYGTLRERYGALRNVTEALQIVMERYGTVTENIDFCPSLIEF